MDDKALGSHGAVRGSEFSPRSTMFEGRFGRLFRFLPPAKFGDNNEESLKELGKLAALDAMTAELEFEDDPDAADPEENRGITARYTYLAQFIDHDLTL